VVSHFPSWDRLYSGEISHFLLTEVKICPTVTYCNFFQMVGGFYLVGDCTRLNRTYAQNCRNPETHTFIYNTLKHSKIVHI